MRTKYSGVHLSSVLLLQHEETTCPVCLRSIFEGAAPVYHVVELYQSILCTHLTWYSKSFHCSTGVVKSISREYLTHFGLDILEVCRCPFHYSDPKCWYWCRIYIVRFILFFPFNFVFNIYFFCDFMYSLPSFCLIRPCFLCLACMWPKYLYMSSSFIASIALFLISRFPFAINCNQWVF